MYLVRDIFNCKPGKAKDIVKSFKRLMEIAPESDALRNTRIMTDVAAEYWTVVFEMEVDKLDKYFEMYRNPTPDPEVEALYKNFHDLVIGGRREIWKIE